MTATRIALDAMGGDDAPRTTCRGALLATQAEGGALPPERIVLVGRRPAIERELAELGGNPGFEILHAEDVIAMGEAPAAALRAKRDSSIAACVRAVREGQAGAVVAMGNTGAAVGAATLGLGTLAGVRRPAIAVTLMMTGRPLTLLDLGANVQPKPAHLEQYGIMGAAYARACLGCSSPRVGLLNVGEEETKGTDVLKEAHRLLRDSGIDFAGNIEGNDIFEHRVDVVVTDGFTGNVVLKLLEQYSTFLLGLIGRELARSGIDLPTDAVQGIRRQIDYAEYGGALLLGAAGVVVIGHGRSDARAVANALGQAVRALEADVNGAIVRAIDAQPSAPGVERDEAPQQTP